MTKKKRQKAVRWVPEETTEEEQRQIDKMRRDIGLTPVDVAVFGGSRSPEWQKEHDKFRKLCAEAAGQPCIRDLRDRLLPLGGTTLAITPDRTANAMFVSLLLHCGRITSGKYTRLRLMRQRECHYNSIRLARRHPKRYQREIGFALSADGLWRSHSWLWDIKANQIVETTEIRTLYFGMTQILSHSQDDQYFPIQ
jgi:hypothetical protein